MASNNNGNMFDSYGITKMLEMISDNYEQNQSLAKNDFAEQMLRQILEVMKVGNAKQLDKKDIQAAFKDVLTPLLKSAFGGGSELTNYLKILQTNIELMAQKQAISAELLANMMSGGVSLGYSTSEKAIATGIGNKPFNIDSKTAKGSEVAKMLESIFGSKIAKKLDSVTDKILAFFGEDRNTRKTRSRQFIDDLAEGLGRSKWVGGALMDLIRLASFFAANWLKQFGPIGKALAVGVVALAPIVGTLIANILTKALVNGLTNVFKTGLLGLGTLLKATFLSLTKNGLFKSALQGNPFAKDAAVSKGNLAVGSFLAAGVVGKMAYDTWKEGGVRNKSAGGILGVGALGFAATGIAALIGGSFAAAVAPIALPIAAIATGIGLIVKFFPQIMDFFRSIGEKLGIIAGKDENGNEKGVPYGSKSKSLGQETIEKMKTRDVGKLKVAQDSSVTNLDKLSQTEAASQLEALRAQDKQAFDNVYEIAEDSVAHMASFQNDIVMKDSDKGGKKGAVLYRGATSDLLDLRKQLKNAGMSEDRANLLMYTSGMSSKDSPHKKGGWKSHSNRYGLSTDIAGVGWTLEESKMAYPILLNALKEKGFDAKVEDTTGFTTVDKMKGDNLHIDIKPPKNVTTEGALVNLRHNKEVKEIQKQYVKAAEQSIGIKKQELEDAKEKAKGKDSEEGEKVSVAEQKAIDEKKAEVKKYEGYKKTIQDATPDQFFTGNDALSSVLKDTVIFAQYQKSQP